MIIGEITQHTPLGEITFQFVDHQVHRPGELPRFGTCFRVDQMASESESQLKALQRDDLKTQSEFPLCDARRAVKRSEIPKAISESKK